MNYDSRSLTEKAKERIAKVYDLTARSEAVLDSYQALGRVTPETLESYNAYLKEYHALALELFEESNKTLKETREAYDIVLKQLGEIREKQASQDSAMSYIQGTWAANFAEALAMQADPDHTCPTCGADYGGADYGRDED